MALILTRRPGESVKIGDNVTMTVREVHPRKIYVIFDEGGVQYPHWANLYEDIHCEIVKVNVTGINRTQVRLAFIADKSIKIVRSELLK
ncbi:MAG TPA: carbon storage regulator [Anaerolineales bacterium]|nr:carbon storage regulator [Anaerolineales bacterium]